MNPISCDFCSHPEADHCPGHVAHYHAKTVALAMANAGTYVTCQGRHCAHPLCACTNLLHLSKSVAALHVRPSAIASSSPRCYHPRPPQPTLHPVQQHGKGVTHQPSFHVI
jgi:hypothetical protein